MRPLVFLPLVACSFGGEPAQPVPPEPLAHLVGCWRSVGIEGDRWSVAYAVPEPGVVLGTTRQLAADGSVSEERERFEVGDDGALGVTSVLDGVQRDRFVLDPQRTTAARAVFARQREGWPRWLAYTGDGESLRVEVGGEGKVIAVELASIACG